MLPFSDDDLLEPVLNSFENIRPMLLRDGGDIELLGVKNGVVYVRLQGHCHGCPSSDTTLKYGIEKQLKIDIHPEICVKNIPLNQDFDIEKI